MLTDGKTIPADETQVRLYDEEGKFIAIYKWKEKDRQYHIVKMFFND